MQADVYVAISTGSALPGRFFVDFPNQLIVTFVIVLRKFANASFKQFLFK